MDARDWPWSNEQKRKYVWGNLTEAAQKAGSNTASYFAYIVKDEGDYEPIFLDRSEQLTILQDFDAEGKIRLIGKNSDQKHTYDFELLEPKRTERSPYSRRITSIADLVKDIELRSRVMKIITQSFGVFDAREIKATQAAECEVHESEDGLLLLMDELGLTHTYWDSFKHQTHRVIGNRYVNVFFDGSVVKKLADAMSGRSSIIRTKAVEQVASLIKDLMSQGKLNDFFLQVGVPTSLLLDNQHSKHDLVYNVVLALSSTGEQEDRELLDRIFEELAHPLTFQGNTKNAFDFQYKITKVIRYDGLSLLGGKMHAFAEADEAKMDELEKKENEVDPALAESLSTFFSGNPFGGSFSARKTPTHEKVVPDTKPVNEKKEPSAVNIHIHNANQNSQTIHVPLSDSLHRFGSSQPSTKTTLAGLDITFDDDKAQLLIGKKVCQLPPTKNGHYLCRAMFEHPAETPVDWSIIYEKMNGYYEHYYGKPFGNRAQWRSVYDTMLGVNDVVKEVVNTDDDLFTWSEKTIRRNH